MAHYGTLKDASVADAADDIRGSHLYGLTLTTRSWATSRM